MATPEEILQAKIDIVQEKRFHLIDLKSVKLTRFPTELFQLPWLEEIDLRQNLISIFPAELADMEDHPEVITLSGRWQNYRRQVDRGVLTYDQMTVDKSRIDQSLMALIERLEEGE